MLFRGQDTSRNENFLGAILRSYVSVLCPKDVQVRGQDIKRILDGITGKRDDCACAGKAGYGP